MGGKSLPETLNTLRPRQNGRQIADDNDKCIFLNVIICISINISRKFVPKGQINNIPVLVQIMTWRRTGDKPLSEPMMVSLLVRHMASLTGHQIMKHFAHNWNLPCCQRVETCSYVYYIQNNLCVILVSLKIKELQLVVQWQQFYVFCLPEENSYIIPQIDPKGN